MIPILILLAVVLIILIVIWSVYNRLVKARNIVEEGFSGIDVQLKKRFELIPNLIEAVKGYNAHEAAVLEKVVAERGGASTLSDVANQDQSITSALKSFRIQVEAYPDLKANTQFLKLMDNLSDVENDLSMSRRYYNGTVRDLNNKIEVFPNVMFSKMFGFKPAEFYEISEANERATPNVDLTK